MEPADWMRTFIVLIFRNYREQTVLIRTTGGISLKIPLIVYYKRNQQKERSCSESIS